MEQPNTSKDLTLKDVYNGLVNFVSTVALMVGGVWLISYPIEWISKWLLALTFWQFTGEMVCALLQGAVWWLFLMLVGFGVMAVLKAMGKAEEIITPAIRMSSAIALLLGFYIQFSMSFQLRDLRREFIGLSGQHEVVGKHDKAAESDFDNALKRILDARDSRLKERKYFQFGHWIRGRDLVTGKGYIARLAAGYITIPFAARSWYESKTTDGLQVFMPDDE